MKIMKKLSITCLAVLLTVSLVPLQVSAYTGKSDINTDRIMRDALNGPMTFLRNNPDVRQESKNNFKADFKNAKDVWWWRADNMDQVRFTLNGKTVFLDVVPIRNRLWTGSSLCYSSLKIAFYL